VPPPPPCLRGSLSVCFLYRCCGMLDNY
jgi:hypothetical protein